jgi:hypothetical protein
MTKKKVGRPRTIPPNLEPFTARLSISAKHRVKALGQILDRPAYEILEEGFWTYWENLPEDLRQAAETIATTVEKVQEAKSAKKASGGE